MRNTIRKLVMVPYTFTLMNWAAVAGLYHFTHGTLGVWNPVRARHA